MKIKMILPSLIDNQSIVSSGHRIAYSRFPPLSLATLAGYLEPHDEVRTLMNMLKNCRWMTLRI